MDAKALIQQGDMLFGKRGTLMMFWQESAEQFYPERADFTVIRTLGTNYADNLARRAIPSSCGANSAICSRRCCARPRLAGFRPRPIARRMRIRPPKQWLEAKSKVMRRAMYDPESLFTEATKEADHDFAAFGNAVITVEVDARSTSCSIAAGICVMWPGPTISAASSAPSIASGSRRRPNSARRSPARSIPKVQEKMSGSKPDPYRDVNVRHIVMEAADYQGEFPGKGRRNVKYVSIFIDTDNNHVIEVTGQTYMMYVIPRWQTVSGSQYGFSPAAGAALPEARLLQAMTATLLEAGEKATNPPMIGVGEALRSDLALYAGGFTSIDADYDESTKARRSGR
jgi:hypothetical protein